MVLALRSLGFESPYSGVPQSLRRASRPFPSKDANPLI
jgi:hypothetical protein